MAGEEGRARVSQCDGNQTHSHGCFPRGIGPLQLSFRLPARTCKASDGQKKQGCSPVLHPEANYARLAWACHISTAARATRSHSTICEMLFADRRKLYT